MQYTSLGTSGLKVSRIALGCMSFGSKTMGAHTWTLNEETSQSILYSAFDKGINFFDTANVYSLGDSERIVGRFVNDVGRHNVVLATKVYEPMSGGPLEGGLSRRSILREIDQSLNRLQTDYVDLYIIHRWDPATPIEETMHALHELVLSGKVRYLGASSMKAWQFGKAQYIAELHNLTKFINMQNHYNLLFREEEREMLPLCIDQGVGVTPWSPLARGLLARPYSGNSRISTNRSKSDRITSRLYFDRLDRDKNIIAAVQQVAQQHDTTMACVALAWLMSQQAVTAPIVGATDIQQLDAAVEATDLILSSEEISHLEQDYTPRQDVLY